MRGEAASSNTHSEMSERSRNHRKRYVEHPKDISKPTCIIHVSDYESDECNVLVGFGSKYAKSRPTKDRGKHSANRNKFNRQQEKTYIVKHTVGEIILH